VCTRSTGRAGGETRFVTMVPRYYNGRCLRFAPPGLTLNVASGDRTLNVASGDLTPLELKRVRELQEELPPRFLQPVLLGDRPVVAVSHEEHRLPVELVGDEDRAGEVAVPARHRERVERGIPLRLDVLADDPQERAGVECVLGPQARDQRGEETAAAPVLRV